MNSKNNPERDPDEARTLLADAAARLRDAASDALENGFEDCAGDRRKTAAAIESYLSRPAALPETQRSAAEERADVLAALLEIAGAETSLNHDAAMLFHDYFASGDHEGAAERARGAGGGA